MEIGTAPDPVQGLCELSTAVDQALTTPRLGVDQGLALAELAELLIIRNKFDALAAVVTQATIDSGAIAASVHRTPGNWVGAETTQSPKSTNADQRLAKWLKRFPEFETAHADGTLSREHLKLLRHADNDVTRRVLVDQQDHFVNTAQTCGFAGFEVAVQYWIDAADPDGQIPREQERSNAPTFEFEDPCTGVATGRCRLRANSTRSWAPTSSTRSTPNTTRLNKDKSITTMMPTS